MKQHQSKKKFIRKYKLKARITGTIHAAGNTNDAEVAVTLKYLSIRKTLEMTLTN